MPPPHGPHPPLPLLPAFFLGSAVLLLSCFAPCVLAVPGHEVTHLPGFQGPLPFHMETGYVGVDDRDEVQLFYYFFQSERDPAEDPLLLWLTGGPGCSAFCGLAFENGPFTFLKTKYEGGLPKLVLRQDTWTKFANIIFLDSPVGVGFSYSTKPELYKQGEISSSRQVVSFMKKWLQDHPRFISNHLYVGGDSYAGKVAPIVTQLLSEEMGNAGKPFFNLKGYVIGNPLTGERSEFMFRIPFLHGMGIISDEVYKSAMHYCEGQDYENPTTVECDEQLKIVKKFHSELDKGYTLGILCDTTSPHALGETGQRRSLTNYIEQLNKPPPDIDMKCREYIYTFSYYWLNNNSTRKALNIKEGTKDEWQRCNHTIDFPIYTQEIKSTLKFHLNLTSRGYRALVYSGDHDGLATFQGTMSWIRSLNYSLVEDWRSWHVDGQVAGYTMLYSNNLRFVTVKGGSHIAPEFKPRECFMMLQRWLSYEPL